MDLDELIHFGADLPRRDDQQPFLQLSICNQHHLTVIGLLEDAPKGLAKSERFRSDRHSIGGKRVSLLLIND